MVIKNWLTLAAGVLFLGAAGHEVSQGRHLLALIFVNYAIANFALAVI